jgi:hypothetical protein
VKPTKREVKQQVETALNVTAAKYGRMGSEKPILGSLNGSSVESVAIVLVNRQSYQEFNSIVLAVK